MAIRFAGPTGGTLLGTGGEDVIWGGSGRDIIQGLAGEDYIYGGSDNDDLFGGPGSDILRGQSGDDRLYGQSGIDVLRGGSGVDQLSGGSGADVLRGGADTDYFVFRATDGTDADTIEDFTIGEDRLVLGGGLQVAQAFREDFNLDGDRDTVLVLTNSAVVLLLDVGTAQNWSLGGGNVIGLSDLPIA